MYISTRKYNHIELNMFLLKSQIQNTHMKKKQINRIMKK
jgi:hypothetical protein